MSKRLENGQKLIEELQKYNDWKFDSILLTDESPVDGENLIWERKC